MSRKYLMLASGLAILAVALGAFAAHGLKAKLSPEQLSTFETGVRYHFYHTFALFIVGLIAQRQMDKKLSYAAYCFAIGILLFSGSLYLLSCKELLGIQNWAWLGPITPLGGSLFILGWLLLLLTQLKKNDE